MMRVNNTSGYNSVAQLQISEKKDEHPKIKTFSGAYLTN